MEATGKIMSTKRLLLLFVTLATTVVALLLAMSHAMAATGTPVSVAAGALPTALAEWLKAWAPWILCSLLPSIAVGLSKSPKTALAATWLDRGIAFAKQALSFFSILTFSDEPGTMQMPLKIGAIAKRMRGPRGPAAVLLVAVGCAAGAQSGCAWWAAHSGGIEKGVIDCGAAAIKQEEANLLPAVQAILSGNSPDWVEQLDALKAVSEDALICAVAAVGSQLSAPKPGEKLQSSASTRARAYVAAGGWRAENP